MKLRDLALPGIALIVLAADQASKAWVIQNVPLNSTFDVIPQLSPWFVLTHITNSGAAFGMFPQLGLVFTFIALGVSFVIVLYHRSLGPGQWLVRLSLGLQLGGAIGNLVDRLRYGGAVVDLFYFRAIPGLNISGLSLPVFNISDLSIVTGVILLMWHLMRTPPENQPAPVSADPPEHSDSARDG